MLKTVGKILERIINGKDVKEISNKHHPIFSMYSAKVAPRSMLLGVYASCISKLSAMMDVQGYLQKIDRQAAYSLTRL